MAYGSLFRQKFRLKTVLTGFLLFMGFGITSVSAHGFGVRHQLELPLYYYVLGAGLTVSLSFVVATFFVRQTRVEKDPFLWRYKGLGQKYFSQLARYTVPFLKIFSILIFFLIISSGLIGRQSPTQNLAPILIWSIWWVGMVYVQALIGDVWRLVNPWSILFSLCEKSGFFSKYIGRMSYPEKLSCWPAVLIFWFFVWLEQVAPFSEQPQSLACLVVAYSLMTWLGMFLFGHDVWLKRAEAFTILFTFLARMAPSSFRKDGDQKQGQSRLFLRPLGVGLLVTKPLDRAATCLILVLLASVTFDGFRDTEYWANCMHWLLAQPHLFKVLFKIQQWGIDLLLFFETLGLILTPLLFFLSYGLISYFAARLSAKEQTPRTMAGSFVLTLVPISFAYHIAHYLGFLLLAGQLAIPLFSDPFNLGWNLFDTLGRQLDIGIIGISTTWWVAVGAVVIGHVYAVYLAHVMALRIISTKTRALISQMPLIILMVCYTMMSLWILAQPIVQRD